jgi:hypothetical protein
MSDARVTPALAVFVGAEHSPVDAVAATLGVESRRLDIERLEEASDLDWPEDGVTWIHFVPAIDRLSHELDEASALLRSARAASEAGAGAGAAVTFLTLLPSHGLLTGRSAFACELARGAFDALVRTEIGSWSTVGNRLVGIVYAGIEGHDSPGHRPSEAVRLRTPMGVLGNVGHLADVIRYLGSRSARYVTGTVIHVDGGWNAYSWIYPARTI